MELVRALQLQQAVREMPAATGRTVAPLSLFKLKGTTMRRDFCIQDQHVIRRMTRRERRHYTALYGSDPSKIRRFLREYRSSMLLGAVVGVVIGYRQTRKNDES